MSVSSKLYDIIHDIKYFKMQVNILFVFFFFSFYKSPLLILITFKITFYFKGQSFPNFLFPYFISIKFHQVSNFLLLLIYFLVIPKILEQSLVHSRSSVFLVNAYILYFFSSIPTTHILLLRNNMLDVIFTLLSTLLFLKNKFYNTALQSR